MTSCLTLPLFDGVPRYSQGYYEASVRLLTGVPLARSDRRIPNLRSEHVQSLAGARCAATALFAFSSRPPPICERCCFPLQATVTQGTSGVGFKRRFTLFTNQDRGCFRFTVCAYALGLLYPHARLPLVVFMPKGGLSPTTDGR